MPTIIAGWLGAVGIGAGVATVAGYVIAGLGLSLVAQKLFGPKIPDLSSLSRGSGYTGDPKRTQTSSVTQPKWVVGEARVGGTLLEYKEDPDDKYILTLRYCISEGFCQELRQIYIDGEEALEPGTKITTRTSIRTTLSASIDNFLIEKYQEKLSGKFVAEAAGFTVIELTFIQPDYGLDDQEEGPDFDKRFWTQVPQVSFHVLGIPWPRGGQRDGDYKYGWDQYRNRWLSDPQNAALWRLWYERIIAKRSGNDITGESNAYDICKSQGYQINGVFGLGDPPDQVRAEMDWCWQGSVVDEGGKIAFKPGYKTANVTTIDASTSAVQFLGGKPGPILSERYNKAKCTLLQSHEDRFLETSIPTVTHTGAVATDTKERTVDLGRRVFVNDESKARQLMAIYLRRTRASKLYGYRLLPSGTANDFSRFNIYSGDYVKLVDEARGIDGDFLVEATSINADWSVTINLREYIDGMYSLSTYSPRVREPYARIPRPNDPVDPPTGLTATVTNTITNNLVESKIDVSWDPSGNRTLIIIRGLDDGYSESKVVLADSTAFIVPTPQTYRITARHRTIKHIDSDNVSVDAEVDWSEFIADSPKNLSASVSVELNETRDLIISLITISWDPQPGIKETGYTITGTDGGEITGITSDSTITIPVTTPQAYRIAVHHISYSGATTASDTISAVISWEKFRPGSPTSLTLTDQSKILADESVEYTISADWDDDPNMVSAQINTTGAGFASELFSQISGTLVQIPTIGEYDVTVKMIGAAGLTGTSDVETVTIDNAAFIPPDPKNPTLDFSSTIVSDGSIASQVQVGWDAEFPTPPAPNYLQTINLTGPDYSREETTRDNSASFGLDAQGQYTATIYRELAGFRSGDVSITGDLDWSGFKPPAPILVSLRQHSGNIQAIFESIPNRDIVGIEFRYRSGDIGGNENLAIINDDNWNAAQRLDVTAIVPSVGNSAMVATASIPATARYRLFARYITRQGLAGDIADLGYYLFSLPTLGTGSINESYLWPGTLTNIGVFLDTNLLVPDPELSAMTRNKFNGNEGWPFGPVSNPTYKSEIIDLGESSNLQAKVDVEFFTPPDPAVAVNATSNYYVRASTSESAVSGATAIKIATGSWTKLTAPAQYLIFEWRGNNNFQGQGILNLTFSWQLLS